jgi:G3E family GTPase
MSGKIPVTVLTGYLGAGKTTLLNRILSEPHGKKYAVIVNEFGEIGIDNDLIVGADEEVFEMNNGCVCCTVRGDLIRIIDGLLKRKGKFDGILVETTGLADPAPVAQTFFVDEAVNSKTALDAVVTVADAKWLKERLKDAPEAKNQIAFADVIVLNKSDLVSADELREVELRIRAINPFAKIHRTTRCAVPVETVLSQGAFDLERILAIEPQFLEDSHHHHDEDVQSFSFTTEKPLDSKRFFAWIDNVSQIQGPNILRAKGILSFKDDPQRYVMQGVHMMFEGDHQQDWRADEKRESRIVFIGRDLNEKVLHEGFEACAA